MPKFKKSWIIVGIGILVVGGLAFAFFGGSDASQYEIITDTVKRGDIVQTVDVTGEVESLQDIDLSFATSGTIGSLRVAVGDRVSAGEVLATLNANDLGADVTAAQAALAQKLAGATDEDIAVAEASVTVAEVALQAAELDLVVQEDDLVYVKSSADASVASAALVVEHAQADIERVVVDTKLDVAQSREDLFDALTDASIAVRSGLSAADTVLGIENPLQNDDCGQELAAGDPASLSAAEYAFERAMKSRDLAEELVYALTDDAANDNLEIAIVAAENALHDASLALLYTRQVLDKTFADSIDCSLAELGVMKDDVDAARTNVQTETTSLNTIVQTYETTQQDAETTQTNAEQALEDAQQDYESAVVKKERDVATAQAAVTSANSSVAARKADVAKTEASLAQVEASPRAVDLAALRADLSAAQARYAKATITAPIGGIVTDVAFDRGEQANAGTTIVTVQADAGQYKIPVSIPESDIAKVSVGDAADVTFDAFGDDVTFSATVASIDPAEKLIEGVVFYEATIVLVDESAFPLPFQGGGQGEVRKQELRPGMSADVTITTEERTNALYLPQRAVLEEESMKFVRIPTDDKGNFERRTVVTSLRADDGFIEIVSGLSEGEVVIVSLKEKK